MFILFGKAVPDEKLGLEDCLALFEFYPGMSNRSDSSLDKMVEPSTCFIKKFPEVTRHNRLHL